MSQIVANMTKTTPARHDSAHTFLNKCIEMFPSRNFCLINRKKMHFGQSAAAKQKPAFPHQAASVSSR